jgi:hypothetical protein
MLSKHVNFYVLDKINFKAAIHLLHANNLSYTTCKTDSVLPAGEDIDGVRRIPLSYEDSFS